MPRAALTAFESPSIANGTPESDGTEFLTNVISGCTDTTSAPFLLRDRSSSLVSAPLECSAIVPLASNLSAMDDAARAISPSGTHSHKISAANDLGLTTAQVPTFLASHFARGPPPFRDTI